MRLAIPSPPRSSDAHNDERCPVQVTPAAGAASSSAARVVAAASGSPRSPDAFGSGGGDGLPERPQKTTREVLSACALTLLRLLSFAAKHYVYSGSNGSSSLPDSVETGAAHTNVSNNSSDTNNNSGGIIIINNNDTGNDDTLAVRQPTWSQAHATQHVTGEGNAKTDTSSNTHANATVNAASDNRDTRHHSGGVPDAIVAVAGSCLAHVAQAIDLAAGPRGALESVLALLLPPAGLLVREQAALTLGAIAGQGFQILTDLREAREASAADSSPSGGGGNELFNGIAAGAAMPEEAGGGRREGKRLLLWRLFCTGVVGGTGAQVGVFTGILLC